MEKVTSVSEILLHFGLKNKVLTFAFFAVALILTIGSMGGGIVRTSFFPRVASDRVSVELLMPNGTHEKVTNSIISLIEEKSSIVNEELTEKYSIMMSII